MSGEYPPLDCDQVKKALTKLGFAPRKKKSGTSHEDWVPADPEAPFRKVTVDCPKAPFSPDLISSMARQAGLNKKEFYRVLGYGKQGKKER